MQRVLTLECPTISTGGSDMAAANGLRVVDVASPANPTEVGVFRALGIAEGIALSAEHVFVADREGGLSIVDFLGDNASSNRSLYLPLVVR